MQALFTAFIKAKRQFGPALKDKNNPHFKSKYADLASCIDAVEAALLANGLAFIQRTALDETGVTVETILMHESGESLACGPLHVPAAKQDPQGYGSALTYARRYSLMAACGIAPEDDDGNAAEKAAKSQAKDLQMPADMRILPTAGAGDMLDEAKRAELADVALYMIDSHANGKDLDAIRIYYELTDNDEKVYVWKLLATESKLRALVKANNPMKATA